MYIYSFDYVDSINCIHQSKAVVYVVVAVKSNFKYGLCCLFSKKTLLFISLLFMTVLLFSSLFVLEVSGHSPPPIDVENEVELRAAINDPRLMRLDRIKLLKDIVLEKSLEIPDGKFVMLIAEGTGFSLIGADGMDTVIVKSGGSLTLWFGVDVTHAAGTSGRGVYVERGGNFTILSNGGIFGNSAVEGGGVYNEGDFFMFGGHISNNSAVEGGGVYNAGNFSLCGGDIRYNECTDTETSIGVGGGVYNEGAFYMTNAHIFGNIATKGGGVYNIGTFIKYEKGYTGSIKSNTALNGEGHDVFPEGNGAVQLYLLLFAVVAVVCFVVVGSLLFYRSKKRKLFVVKGSGGHMCKICPPAVRNSWRKLFVVKGSVNSVVSYIRKALCGMTAKFKNVLYASRKYRSLIVISLIVIVVLVLFSSLIVYMFLDNVISNEAKLRKAVNNAVEPTIIKLNNDITLTETLFIPASKDITLASNSNNAKFFKLIGANNVSTITVDDGGVLRLDGIIVTHKYGDTGQGLIVESGGTLIMSEGEVSGNTALTGGGVFVDSDGFFELHGGVITDNTADRHGGGVCSSGSFAMYGGVIANNKAIGNGGGVYVSYSGVSMYPDFSMYGGVISDNMADGEGGGVCLFSFGSLSLYENAVISGNTAKRSGGGVYISGVSTVYTNFVMYNGGVIANNTAYYHGGGVSLHAVSFSSSGGVIANNTGWYGGGVYVGYGSFTMSDDGVIANNTASMGGGVYVHNVNSVFNLCDGRIYGNTASTGGGVYNFNGVFYRSGGRLFDNTADVSNDVHQKIVK